MSSRPSPDSQLRAAAHPGGGVPSDWVRRFAALVPVGANVLDLAAGGGRHARWLAERGCRVTAVDRDAAALATMKGVAGIETRVLDLEGPDWPLGGEQFDAVVVANYLYRPRFAALFELVRPGGLLIYETFMLGNERFGKPSNPDFLLRPRELVRLPSRGLERGRLRTGRGRAPGRDPAPVRDARRSPRAPAGAGLGARAAASFAAAAVPRHSRLAALLYWQARFMWTGPALRSPAPP